MAGFSDVMEVEILKVVTGQVTTVITTTPITPYLALFTTTPTDAAASGVEATGGGYARISTAGKWAAPTSGAGTVTNNATISLATFTGSVSSGAAFVAFALYDAVTAGSMLMWGALSDITKSGGNTDTVSFPASSLTLTVD